MAPLTAASGKCVKGCDAFIFWSGELLNNAQPSGSLSARLPPKTPRVPEYLPPLSARRANAPAESCTAAFQEHIAAARGGQSIEWRSGHIEHGRESARHLAGKHILARPPASQRPPRRRPSAQFSKELVPISSRAGCESGGSTASAAPAPFDPELLSAVRERGVVLRGDNDECIAAALALEQEAAQRRRSAYKEASQAHRDAVQRRQSHSRRRSSLDQAVCMEPKLSRKQIEAKLGQAPEKLHAMAGRPCSRGSASSSAPSTKLPDSGTSSRQGTEPSSRQSCRSNEPDENRRGSIFSLIAPKTSRAERLSTLNAFCKHGRRMERMKRVVQEEQRAFDQRPEQERRQLSEAFEKCDADSSGCLEPSEMLACLGELGFKPQTALESRELRRICLEVAVLGTVEFLPFVSEVVPRGREKLQELRRGPRLVELISTWPDSCIKMHLDALGNLDAHECREVLKQMCKSRLDPAGADEMLETFGNALGSSKSDDSSSIELEVFQDIVQRVRCYREDIISRRTSAIAAAEGLDAATVHQHKDELILLYHSYRQLDDTGKGLIGWDEARMILIEYNLLPTGKQEEAQLQDQFFNIAFLFAGHIKFSQLLELLRSLRKGQLAAEEHELKKLFCRLDKDNNCVLDTSEVSSLLVELGVQPHCLEDQLAVRRLLDQVDMNEDLENKRGRHLNFYKFSKFVQLVREHLAISARSRQQAAACELGFSFRQVAELREVFFTLDEEKDGFLCIDQLRRALDMLKRDMSPEDLRRLIADIDVAGGGHIDFLSFMHFFKKVVPLRQ